MADNLTTELGFDAQGAIQELTRVTTALEAYTAAMRKAASATRAYNKVGTNFSAIKNLDATLTQASSKSQEFTKNINTLGVSTYAANNKIASSLDTGNTAITTSTINWDKWSTSVKKAGDEVNKTTGSMILSWQSVVRIFAIQVIHQAISQIRSSLSEAAQEARNFEKALAEIQTIGAQFKNDFEGLATQITTFSEITGQPLPIVEEGLYQTLSNQVTDAAHSFEFLATASDFSIAAVTDLGSSVNLLSSVINSYNLSVEDTDEVAGKLFKTIELGRVRGEEFANTYGRILTLAAQLGVSFDEVSAALATLTVTGMRYNEAFTLIQNIQLKLITPTKELKERYKELNVASAEAGIQAYGFQGFLEKIAEGSEKSASAIGELYGRVRAIRGALSLGSQQAEQYKDVLEKIKEAGGQTLEEAKKLVFETNAKQVELELNRVDIAVTNLGRNIVAFGVDFFEFFGGAPEAIQTLVYSLTAGALAFAAIKIQAGFASIGITTFTAAMYAAKTASLAFLTGPWAIIGGITLAVGALVTVYNRYARAAEDSERRVRKALEQTRESQRERLKLQLKSEQETLHTQLGILQKYLFERERLFKGTIDEVVELNTRQFDSLNEQLNTKTSSVSSYFDAIIAKSTEAANKIKGLNYSIFDLQQELSDFRFERRTADIDPSKEVEARLKRTTELQRQAAKAVVAGEIKLAEELYQRAETQARTALSKADETGRQLLIKKSEQAVENSIKNQILLQERTKQRITQEKNAVDQQLDSIRAYQVELNYLQDRFKELTKEASNVKLDPIDRAKINTELTELSARITEQFGKLRLAAIEEFDLKSEFASLNANFFDPITGQLGTFESSVDVSLARVEKRFVDFAATANKPLQDLLDSLVGKGIPSEQQQRLPVLEQEYLKSGKQVQENLNAQQAYNKAISETRTAFAALSKEFDAYNNAQSQATLFAETAYNKQKETIAKVNAEIQRSIGLLQAKNYEGLNQSLERLGRVRDVLGTEDVAFALNVVIKKLQEAAEQSIKIQETAGGQEFVNKVNSALAQSNQAILNWQTQTQNAASNVQQSLGNGISQAANLGAQAVSSSANTQISALQAVEAQARRTAAAVAGAQGGGKALGGLVYLSTGGYVKGTDSVLASLTVGETVVNTKASKTFAAQLAAMNAGVRPAFKSQGGTVINVGDINVNMTKDSDARQTALKTGDILRREIKRNTFRRF